MRAVGRLLVLVTLLTLFLPACGGTSTPAPATATEVAAPTPVPATEAAAPTQAPAPTEQAGAKSELTIVVTGDPTTLDPQVTGEGNERAVNDNIYETLLTTDPEMNLVPLLATGYEQVDPTTWQFKLREGVKFQNGEPFNADAVVFSIKRIIDPEFNSEMLSFFPTISDVVKVDDTTVNVITSDPDPILPSRLYWVRIVPPQYAQADPDKFANNPVGTGPYRFVKWEKAVRVTLEANPDYWGGAPSIDIVHIRLIQEGSTRQAALQAGEVDLITGLSPEHVEQVPVAVHTPGLEFPIIRLNTKEGLLADVRIRQAINYAVDKEAIAEALFGGYAVVADGQMLTSDHFGYNPNVKAYPYDPEKAKELLKEADYNGEEIILVGTAGRWLKDKELIETVANQLNEVGLNVKVSINEWGKFLDALLAEENKPQMIFVSHDNPLMDADLTFASYYECGARLSSYCNEEVTKMIIEGRTEIDVAKREAIYHEVVQTVRDDAAFLFLVNFENIYGLSERVEWTPRRNDRLLYATMSLKP